MGNMQAGRQADDADRQAGTQHQDSKHHHHHMHLRHRHSHLWLRLLAPMQTRTQLRRATAALNQADD